MQNEIRWDHDNSNVDEIVQDIISLHELCHNSHARANTIAIGIPESGYQYSVSDAKEKATLLNTELKKYCSQSQATAATTTTTTTASSKAAAYYMPFPFVYEPHGVNWSPDTLHFSKQGYKVLGESLVPYIEKIFS